MLLREESFRLKARVPALPAVSLEHVSCSGRWRPSAESGRGEIMLLTPLAGPAVVCQGGREAIVEEGAAVILRSHLPNSVRFSAPARYVNLCLPESALRPLVPDLDATVMQVIPAENAPLRLLLRYIGALATDRDAATSPHAAPVVADHLYDLVARTIELARQAEPGGGRRALRASRLWAVKRDINRRAGNTGLTVDAVARRQQISPSYVRKLLAGAGTSFSACVLEQRLALAHRMLCDPSFANRNISAIAYKAGFSDLSYFNRSFRRRYAATPSKVRAEALARPQTA